MSKLDRLKEEIGWLKIAFGIVVALDASLIAWLAKNYDAGKPLLIVVAMCAAVALSGVIAYINLTAYRRIREMEDL